MDILDCLSILRRLFKDLSMTLSKCHHSTDAPQLAGLRVHCQNEVYTGARYSHYVRSAAIS